MRTYAAAIAGLLVLCGYARGQQQVSDEQVLSDLRGAEQRLLNLTVRSSFIVEQWNAAGGKWEDDGSGSLRACFTGRPGSKIRVEHEKERVPWVGGPVPFSVSTFTQAYNGKTGQTLYTNRSIIYLTFPGSADI